MILILYNYFIYLFIYLLLDCSGFWASRVGPVDNLLEGLKDRLKMTLLYSKANGTVVAYNHAFRRWKQFANDRLNGKAFPAGPFQVALYLQHIIEKPTPIARSILLSMT